MNADAWQDRHAAATSGRRWEGVRRLVFRRCGGVCEGCGAARAVLVHHLTYAHLGNELLFELVGLCRACHDLAHDRDGGEWGGGDEPEGMP